MQRLRRFVTGYVRSLGLDIGYASALEVLATRRGDCTEDAVLLAALARARGIPARVVTGIVYTGRYAGRRQIFVPHAWTQAWVGGRWESFDSALGRFDSGHIALSSGNGDPQQYLGAWRVFGRMQIESVPRGAGGLNGIGAASIAALRV